MVLLLSRLSTRGRDEAIHPVNARHDKTAPACNILVFPGVALSLRLLRRLSSGFFFVANIFSTD